MKELPSISKNTEVQKWRCDVARRRSKQSPMSSHQSLGTSGVNIFDAEEGGKANRLSSKRAEMD